MKTFLMLLALFCVGFAWGCSCDPTPEPAQPEDISVPSTEIPEPMIQVPMEAVESAHTIAHHKTQVAGNRILSILREKIFGPDAVFNNIPDETRSVLLMLANAVSNFRMEVQFDFYFMTRENQTRCLELHEGFTEMLDIITGLKDKDPRVPDEVITYLTEYTNGLKSMAHAIEEAHTEKTE